MTQKKMDEKCWKLVAVGLICVTALEAYALSLGFNGTMLKTVLIIIALAIGVTIPNPLTKK
tara:strand:- start:473 stop:655 length:183 start_codon:yes stop_codon:yes gene_type:complete